MAGEEGLGRLLRDHDCVSLVAPTLGAPFRVCLEGGGDGVHGAGCLVLRRTTLLPAVSGYPHLTVPMGAVDGGGIGPVGLSFLGPPNSEAMLLRMGHAFEQQRLREQEK